jgi:hypothetical protein
LTSHFQREATKNESGFMPNQYASFQDWLTTVSVGALVLALGTLDPDEIPRGPWTIGVILLLLTTLVALPERFLGVQMHARAGAAQLMADAYSKLEPTLPEQTKREWEQRLNRESQALMKFTRRFAFIRMILSGLQVLFLPAGLCFISVAALLQ